VVHRFGAGEAARLLPQVHAMEREFYSSNAHQVANDLAEMEAMSSDEFKRTNPDAPDDAVRALAWCYTFDYK
jgi:hypothetical protein